MASGQSVFKGALGWDDWIWWVAIGCVALLILLLLVCCCVCMQRAKRKGHEEALASVQARQRLTQERERAEHLQQQQQQQAQRLQAQNGYQPPGYAYSKQVTAVPLAPAPSRKNAGPQVAANGYRDNASQLHRDEFAKAYPPLPGQQQQQQQQQAAAQEQRNYQPPPKWFNAQRSSPLSHGYEANAPRLSSGSFDYNSQYPDSMRYDDPYAAGGGPDGVPFVSVTSPSASKSLKNNRKNGVKLQNQPAPVVVPTYTQAPPSPSEARASAGSSAVAGGTLQSRIDALRSADSNDMVHSRISVTPDDVPGSSPSSGGRKGGPMWTVQMPRALTAQESYASGSARRSGLLVGSVLSPDSSAMSPSPFSSPSASLKSGLSYETFDPDAFESPKATELGAVITHGSSRSIGSDYSHGQFEDAESFGAGGRTFKRQNSSNESAMAPGKKPSRADNVSINSRGSVEF
ncbi:Shisa family [Phytophthora cinnamomi]|uniref:Shisa family n=1 Tax=Phytophthora cinnamomi TaxID=4785 RepID=UPI00355A5B18|nr:Shisa family [Phytophthora cinnamomi]